jgi:starvation-inducible DNA-binding protein
MARPECKARKKINISIQPNIGLETGVRMAVIGMLNLLLADEAVLSFKLAHAEIHPDDAVAMGHHVLYVDQQQQIETISNQIVERIQILGGVHADNPEKLIGSGRLDGIPNGLYDIIHILADHEAFIRFLRDDVQKCFELYDDLGTQAMLISILRDHEKMAWRLRSQIKIDAD